MKNILKLAVISAVALIAVSCSKAKEENKDTTVVANVVGDEIVMPEAGTDTSEVAEGTAIVVQDVDK